MPRHLQGKTALPLLGGCFPKGHRLAWLGLIGAGLTYFLWFRGISRLEPTVVSLLGFLSPGTAVLLGWLFLDQTLSALQIIGVLLVIGSIWLGQRSNRTPRARIACRKSP